MSEREYKALRGVPASTWMEGFCVTKQMEKACMCLMSGEVSVTAQSQTVSRAHRFPLSVASCQHGKRDSIGTPTEGASTQCNGNRYTGSGNICHDDVHQ